MTSKRWAVVAGGLMIAGACTKAPQFTAADEAVLKGMFDSTTVWLKAHNYTEWSTEFAETGYMQPPNGKTITGRPALVAWATALPPIEQISFGNVMVAGDGNMAYGSSTYVLKLKDAPADTGKQVIVFRRGTDGKWAIVGGGFNSDLPPVAPAPAPTLAGKTPAKK